MSTKQAIRHAMYTNVPGADGEGFRLVLCGGRWTAAELDKAKGWLAKLRPEVTEEEAVATGCLRLEGVVHAVFAGLDARFGRDRHGRRGGWLTHGLFLALDEESPPGDFGSALLQSKRRLKRPQSYEGSRLDAFVETCRRVTHVEVPPPRVELVRSQPSIPWEEILAALEPGSRDGAISWPAANHRARITGMVCACSLLPPRLRLALSWHHGLRNRDESSVRLLREPRSRGTGHPSGRQSGHRSSKHFVETLERADSRRLARLAGDWDVRSLFQWMEEVDREEVA